MEPRTRREADSGAVPSAKFLQARITALSTTLIKRLENIFAVALDDDDDVTGTADSKGNVPPPPPLTVPAVQQIQLDVESTALIRAAEEIMVLTRTMKEIWLFAGLETIKSSDSGEDEEKAMEDMQVVETAFREFLRKFAETEQLGE